MRKDSKKGTCMHSLYVSVCPCLSETVYLLYGHILLDCSDMLLCPNLQLKTASSSSWGESPTSFLTQNTCFNVSLELQGDCSDQLTLICRHSDGANDPNWIYNGTVEGVDVLGTVFPGALYTVQALKEPLLE